MDISEIHSGLLRILIELDELCRNNNIYYSLHAGTLIGAVREHGFIAWDDDADIAMTRDEYEKLEKAISFETDLYLRGKIKCQVCAKSTPNLWVDIFILDYISEKKLEQKLKLGLLTVLDIMSRDKKSMMLSRLDQYSKGKRLVYKGIYSVGKLFAIETKQHWYHEISRNRFLGSRKSQIRSNDRYAARNMICPSAWMSKYEDVSFEGKTLMMTSYYDQLLSSVYGDYMKPVKEEGQSHTHDLVRENAVY